MLKRNKAVSIVMALCLCLAMLAPVFVAPQSAEASCTYEVVKAPTIGSQSVASGGSYQNLGVIKVTLPDPSLFSGQTLTVSMPSDIKFESNDVSIDTKASSTQVSVVAAGDGSTTSDYVYKNDFENLTTTTIDTDTNEFDLKMADNLNSGKDQIFYIYFNGIDMNNLTGDIDVSLSAPSSSAFDSADNLVIAKSTSSGSTTTSIKKVDNITDGGANTIEPITVQENSQGSLTINGNKEITLEILTNGYNWDTSTAPTADYGWGDPGSTPSYDSSVYTDDNQKIAFKLNGTSPSTPTKITFSDLAIEVNDSKANVGDEVQVKVSGADMDSQTLTVAKYVDYTATVEEGTTKTLIAGQKNQDIGDFYIEEGAANSLTKGRSIELTLPSGVEWCTDNEKDDSITTNCASTSVDNGSSIDLISKGVSGDNNEISKFTVNEPSTGSKNGAKIKFKDMKVCVSPAFTGDLNITVSGSADVTGTVKVGTVVPAATITPGDVVNVQLGKPDQKINDITITEGTDGGLLEHDLTLKLDDGYTWAQDPTVKVTNGNLDIDDNVTTDENVLTIPITGDSSTASTIAISDIYINADRTAPEGPVTLQFGKNDSEMNNESSTDENNSKYATATNEVPEYWNKSAGKVTIANCVTAAETSGSNVFTIGSNVFECNGTKAVMDVAPYIKSSRTYVPMRYLAQMVGADVAWDATAQTVTLTKGSTVVVFTIGSNTYTVNGAAQTADVAPEIVNSRTFLPARFVAEAFGYQAGWDAGTSTVVISD